MESAGKSLTYFITVEGGEGVGKSTFCTGLAERLRSLGIPLILTREPGGTAIAQKIRELFLNPPVDEPLTPVSELFLVSASRSQHVAHRIQPSLQKGEWVLCDRFYDSTRVYQGILGGLDQGFVETINQSAVDGCRPHLTFLLDCDVHKAQQRLQQRVRENGGADETRFDLAQLEFHHKLREAFLQVAAQFSERIVVLDASQGPDELLKQAFSHIQTRLNLGHHAKPE